MRHCLTGRGRVGLGVALALGISGFSSCASAHSTTVREVTAEFAADLGSGDGAAACALLAPATRERLEHDTDGACADEVLRLDLPDLGEPTGTEVFGTMAQVQSAADTVFVARFESGWKVWAAGCTAPPPGQPSGSYRCQLEGG